MLHKAWNSKGEMPYCFPRSSIKFQGHTVQNITEIGRFRTIGRSQLSNPSDLPCCKYVAFMWLMMIQFYRCHCSWAHYTPVSTKLKGGILVSRCRSVCLCPPVCPWTESCILCIFHNTHWIHFILCNLSSNPQRRVACKALSKIPTSKFRHIFEIHNFDRVLFWLWIQYESIVCVIMGRWRYSQYAGVLVVLVFAAL